MPTASRPAPTLTYFWFGVAAAITAEVVLFGARYVDRKAAETATVIFIPISLFIVCCYAIFVYQSYAWLRDRGAKLPRGPWEAVLVHLIPFYNLFVMFRWPREVLRALQVTVSQDRLAPWWPGVAILSGFVLGKLSATVGCLLIGAGLHSVARGLQEAP